MECGDNTMIIPDDLSCCQCGYTEPKKLISLCDAKINVVAVKGVYIAKKQPKQPNQKKQEIKRVKYRNPMKHLQPKKNKRKR